MKTKLSQKLVFTLACALFFIPVISFAHQPQLPDTNDVTVSDPEISKAYYATLNGAPHVYTIASNTPFELYVNILVPDIKDQKKDVTAKITNGSKTIATLGGTGAQWEKYFEPFGYDHYFQGPEHKAQVEPGTYTITVSSPDNDSKYSLAVGETEAFNLSESYRAVTVMPELKRNFFKESPATFLLSPFGIGYVVVLFVLSFIFGFAYRFVLKRIAKTKNRKRTKNIGKGDKVLRIAIGAVLFVLAVTTSWSPFLFFFSGFAFFEAIFSWCGFYAALGKNTCPL